MLSLTGVEDVKIYNNNSGSSIPAADSTSIPAHNQYVILRTGSASVEDSVIADIIYKRLTPGIQTTASSVTADSKSFSVPNVGGRAVLATQNVYWKQATPVHPKITIGITPSALTGVFSAARAVEAGNEIKEWLNNLPISTNLTQQALTIKTMSVAPAFRGALIYTAVSSVSITGASSSTGTYTNQDTYYNYTTVSYSSNTITIE